MTNDIITRFQSGQPWLDICRDLRLSAVTVMGELYRAGALNDAPAHVVRPEVDIRRAVRCRTRKMAMRGGMFDAR